MAQNIGTLVTAAIRPNDSLDLIASAFANEVMGGLHRANDITDRNSIIDARREWGMMCYVISDTKTYQLSYGYGSTIISDNNNWIEFSGSGSGGGSSEWLNSVLSVLMIEPLSPADGDRYLVGLVPIDIIIGSNWTPYSPGFVAQWSSAISSWNRTIPLDGMSVRVDDQDNSIYRYEGTYPTGYWQKEKVNQVRYINANLISGGSYSAASNPYLLDYENEALYIVKFNATNIGASVSLSINNLPHKTIRKIDGVSLTNINSNELTTNYQYLVTYNGTQFELPNPAASGASGSILYNKYFIDSTENINVPINTQYWIYGDIGIEGSLDNYGQVVVANGSLNILNSGVFNNYGTYSNIYFAEINGLGQLNYIPRWVTSHMLAATSSIYDDTNEVIISSPTFSVLNDIVLPKGAQNGYILTSDSNGVSTWQEGVTKFSATFSFGANATQSITHNLNSSAIIFNFWNEDTGSTEVVNISKTGLNTIDVMSTVAVVNGRVVIIS